MRRVLYLLALLLCCTTASAQRSLDFASKYMQEQAGDSTLQCITVGPKMIEQIIKVSGDSRKFESLKPALEKLKSARMITTDDQPEQHYQQAEALLKQHSSRFAHQTDFDKGRMRGAFYTRQDRDGNTVELVMLAQQQPSGAFIVVNITGDIDEEFIEQITQATDLRAN